MLSVIEMDLRSPVSCLSAVMTAVRLARLRTNSELCSLKSWYAIAPRRMSDVTYDCFQLVHESG